MPALLRVAVQAFSDRVRFKTGSEEPRTNAVVYVLDPNWLGDHIDELPATKKRREDWDANPKHQKIAEDDRDIEYENGSSSLCGQVM
jgi:hypothetical protein